ncbi:helix-turn-helix domain-containing protein [Cupriavidus taiwanensis]|uniref:winged helix-turn-helix transcriptional regulator n=1 Tax=Cupriavidus taiwanensis TaxID=164546 RepID=UPI000E104A74|nr:helix-turn-helix domain-containing protein [Cupriavidus taiwanensis]SOY72637.1 putative transcriptional regulator, HxlR family [Cupriavidus taiwanensis]SOY72830.1 putative transcriptional regulator, HxlR family [Cupriavidus taiwanensis]SOY96744.1 putative transcriptional regulator, HxlR family [Cupriavidus taiwanensis]SOZ30753.1 putative transcriptional regulator, HxlR family [Cupriavidus taiwanensis]SOZ66660.1 putative transcriptional regulator, HxlR family [Cupriavidus taiwanensis]
MLGSIMTTTASDLRHCSIASTLSLIGEKWTILILRDVFHGVTRFDDFLRRLECSPAVLSARLKTLTDAGLLRKVGYREPGERERFEYRPTRAAVELLPVLVGLMQWGDCHLAPDGGPVEIRSRANGKLVRAALVDEDGVEVSPRDMQIIPVQKPAGG